MESVNHPAGLEIDTSARQQRLEWRLQRVAWLLLSLLLIAVSFGLLGRGPLSDRVAHSADGRLQLEFQRVVRVRSPETLKVALSAPAPTVELQISAAYARAVDIESFNPQPERVTTGEQALTFAFRSSPGQLIEARIDYLPDRVGPLDGWIGVAGSPRLRFRQFALP